jgi:sterol desaturase/sphingolipid hydroxylase (fatty acid hydroxylase superfamily)
MLFGTFYLPQGRLPTKFGIVGDSVPDHFWGQMMYPFRIKRTDQASRDLTPR